MSDLSPGKRVLGAKSGLPRARGSQRDASESLYKVQVLDRAFKLLDCFTPENPERGVTELAKEVPLHKATAHRILSVLERWGYVQQVNETGQYRLGTKLIELAGRALEAMSVARVAKPQLEDLVATTGETAHLMVFDANEGLYVEKVESPRSFRMPSQVGRRIPLHCTGVGKALLAYLPPEDVERVIAERGLPALSPNTITTPRALAKELATIRDRGYAIDAEEIELGLRCIAAPVFDHTGSVAASISIAGPSARLTPSRDAELALRVMAAAAEISRQLGHVSESRPPVAETA